MENYNIYNILRVTTDIGGLIPDTFLVKNEPNFKPQFRILRGIIPQEGSSITIAQGQKYYEKIGLLENKLGFLGFDMSSSYKVRGEEDILFLSEQYVKYGKHIPVPISGLYPLEHLVKLYMQVELLKRGFSFLISGAFEYANGKAALICGPIGMGKTTNTFRLMEKSKSFRFLGDDTLVTNGNEVFSYPRMARLRGAGSTLLSVNKHVPPQKLVDEGRMIKKSCPDKVFFLERSNKNCIVEISPQDTLARFRAVNNKILSLHIERLLCGCAYLGLLDGIKLDATHDEVLKRLISKVSSFYTVKADSLEKSSELIYEKCDQGK